MKLTDGFESFEISDEQKEMMRGCSYHGTVTFDELRYIKVMHYDFNGKKQEGEIVVHKDIEKDILEIFYELYLGKYPIEKIRLIDHYDGDDVRSMEDNNSSGFNDRVVANTNEVSMHSFGKAIDINPRINPYITEYELTPANGAKYKCRNPQMCTGKYRDYMIHEGDLLHEVFTKHGFLWGVDWKRAQDYQHFVKYT